MLYTATANVFDHFSFKGALSSLSCFPLSAFLTFAYFFFLLYGFFSFYLFLLMFFPASRNKIGFFRVNAILSLTIGLPTGLYPEDAVNCVKRSDIIFKLQRIFILNHLKTCFWPKKRAKYLF